MDAPFITPRSIFKIGIAAVLLLVALISVPNCVEWLDAKHVMVIQYPNGGLAAFSEPGPKAQWFGTVTKYERRAQYEFDNDKNVCTSQADTKGYAPMKVRFAEGGHALLCGALSWEMPTKPELLFNIQKDFGSQHSVEQALVSKALTNAIYFSGQMMTSTESSAERRAELLNYIEDQMKEGVYQTVTKQERQVDPLTKQERTIGIVQILKDKEGRPQRNNRSAIGEYGITLVQTSISEIKYEAAVEEQIKQQQQAKTQVQIAIANAIRAEQDARTTAKQGEANVAKAEWEQKTIAAKEVAKAEQEKKVAETHALKVKEVAKLEKEAAEYTKQRDILLGQGESEKRRLILAADGALEKKLEAYVAVNQRLADAIKEAKPGAWSPQVIMGGNQGGTQHVSGTQGAMLIDLLTAKTARDLQLDMSVKK